MLKRTSLIVMTAVLTATLAAAQTAAPAAPAAPPETKKAPAAKTAPEPAPLPVNIKIDVSITDQSGNGPAAKKLVTMIASDRQSTIVRSSATVSVKIPNLGPGPTSYSNRNVQINVDARPSIVAKEPNKVSVAFGLEYLPTGPRVSAQEEMEPGMTSWNERLSVILESGKPMIVSQAADPTSDRKITVEITATILK